MYCNNFNQFQKIKVFKNLNLKEKQRNKWNCLYNIQCKNQQLDRVLIGIKLHNLTFAEKKLILGIYFNLFHLEKNNYKNI